MSLKGATLTWYERLTLWSLGSFDTLVECFSSQYVMSRLHGLTSTTLASLRQTNDESLHKFMDKQVRGHQEDHQKVETLIEGGTEQRIDGERQAQQEQDDEPAQQIRGVINTIRGGFSHGGLSSQSQKRYLHAIKDIDVNCVDMQSPRSLPPITFTYKDFKGINTINQDNPIRSDKAAAPPEATPTQVELVAADPHSPVADPSSPELEAAPPSSPIIIISEDPTESTSREVVALSDSPVFHLIDEEETQDHPNQWFPLNNYIIDITTSSWALKHNPILLILSIEYNLIDQLEH
ncbi:hypothetical protein JHK85_028338 [Glycine max]|nr:hypothetical protein JHK85_028338 [Glycine max]